MNVTCTGCPAKYAVPDDKVRGKKVRITCKHCGTNIVVDGTAGDASDSASLKPSAQAAAPAPVMASVPAAAPAPSKAAAEPKPSAQAKPAAETMYIVGFADDRQSTHTISQIVEMYGAGKIDDEALVWKDGMADWLSPFDVPELAAAFRAKNVAPRAVPHAPGFAPVAEDEATLVVRSPVEELARAAAGASAPAAAPTPAAGAAPAATRAPAEAAPPAKAAEESMFGKPAAARRVEKRAGSVDLFGKVSEAGSEGDVSLDLASDEHEHERAQKLTGARNESSVLFSLDALTKPDPKATQAKDKRRDEEASVALFGESAPDSLLNLGGGALGAMAAPDFTKPVSAAAIAQATRAIEADAADGPANKGRGGVVLLVGFVAIAAAAAVAFVMMKKQPAADAASIAPSATSQAAVSAEPSVPAVTAEPAASSAPATSASAASAGSAAPAAANEAATSSPTAGSAKPSAGTPAASPTTPAPANKPADAPAAAAAAAAAPAAKPPEAAAPAEGAAFDKNAAVAALGAAAASAGSCKQADGPTGSGKVSVTFAPSGRATATSVAGELAGTEVGGCVARLFRSAKVPPFTGDPVTVSKSFSVQ